METNYKVLVFDLETKVNEGDETAEKAKRYLNFFKNSNFLYYVHFLEEFIHALNSFSLAFQSDKLLRWKLPQKLDKCCAVTDTLTMVPGNSITKLMENLQAEDESSVEFKSER